MPQMFKPPVRPVALLAAAFAVATSFAAIAQAPGKDELWDVTMKMEMAGMPMAMPPRTNRVCVEKGNDEALVPKGRDNCVISNAKRTGNKYTFNVACTGKDPMSGSGEFTYSSDGYDGKMQMKGTAEGQPFDMTQTVTGKRVGTCTSTVKADVARANAQIAQGNQQVAEMCRQSLVSLNWQMYEPTGPCADKRADFCPAVSKVAATAREPASYAAARKDTMLADAMGKCGQVFGAVTAAACAKGLETRDWSFVGSGSCDAEVRTAGEANCKGRSFTGMDRSVVPLCSRYASLVRGQPAATATAAPTPAKAPDPVQEGVNALKKLLPF